MNGSLPLTRRHGDVCYGTSRACRLPWAAAAFGPPELSLRPQWRATSRTTASERWILNCRRRYAGGCWGPRYVWRCMAQLYHQQLHAGQPQSSRSRYACARRQVRRSGICDPGGYRFPESGEGAKQPCPAHRIQHAHSGAEGHRQPRRQDLPPKDLPPSVLRNESGSTVAKKALDKKLEICRKC